VKRASTVYHPETKRPIEVRPWTLPVLISICRECGFPAIGVSAEAVNLATWDHVAAIHLGVERVATAAAEGLAK